METEVTVKRKTNPKEKANFLSLLVFFYQFPTFIRNYKQGLTENDLYEPLNEHKAAKLGDNLEDVWTQQHRKHKKSALHRALIKIFGLQFIVIGIFQFINQIVQILVLPLGVGGLVSYFESSQNVSQNTAYMYTGLIVLSLASDLFISCHTDLAMAHMAMKLRVSCCSMIYRKTLKLSRAAVAQTTIGQIVNLLSNDVGKFDEGFVLCHYVWMAPLQTMIGTYLLYDIIGVTAFPGVGFLIFFIPLQMYFGKKTSELRLRTALRTDERVRLMNEILNAIQVIKMYSWEKPFAKLISFARRYEIKSIRANFFLEGITFCLEMVITRIAVFITIIILVYTEKDIKASVIYSVIAIYDVLRPSMTLIFSYAVSSVAETYITMSRIQNFLNNEELYSLKKPETVAKGTADEQQRKTGAFPKILINNVTAQWDSRSANYNLTDINISLDNNQLVGVVGEVGSGKSNLFQLILKELPIIKGCISIDGQISYAAQEGWLFSASVRQNILFGEPFEEDRYANVLKLCALEADLAILPYGDKTIVGEKGKVLSGGQKARINLARCIYKKADIYLLDDPLSAVDNKVGKHIFEECITKFLIGKLCILITHQLQYLQNVDNILIFKDGQIAKQGTYEELQKSELEFATLLREFNNEDGQTVNDINTSRKGSKVSHYEDDELDPILNEETMQSGSVSAKTYLSYLKYGGNYFIIIVLCLIFVAAHGTSKVGDLYVSEWVNLEEEMAVNQENTTLDRDAIIYEYSGIIVLMTIFAACQSAFSFMFFMKASINMHNSIFSIISYATMRFFNLNPTGRILNRFSKDMGTVDEYLPYIIYDVVQIALFFIGSIVVTSIINPWLLFPAAGILIVFCLLRNIYLVTSRSVKRIEGISRL